ncbi:FAD-dependent oxidoreductase [Parvularcula sp. ZS-1/3]|uniref:FAD-dependent oxidoreductase n=1 Tax=Parvularcula mediterranea TaxID=2732508 RepID=A0A7Y3RLF5_9PROT|nr:FAD-dependent oxidoreductase [Parvularcula mediterranea]NNU16243.1 FAD-dependent oxidoreductase [Parvularcula mediterranea]
MADAGIVIVGAGQAGAAAATKLRQMKVDAPITVIGAEPDPPYERPPLSKDYLSGERSFDRLLIRPETFWANQDVAFKLGAPVTAVDAEAKTVTLEGGETVPYDTLIWATGGSPRKLACQGGDLPGVHTVRSRIDADRMKTELPTVKRAIVIGGGYIGLEAAAVLRKHGREVVLLEAAPRLLSRVAGEALSSFFAEEHARQGVDLRIETTADCIVGDAKAEGVHLADGSGIEGQMVVVGIGIIPDVAPLADAGAEVSNGVHVDAECRTNLPDVFAIGDCALHPNGFAGGEMIRLESVQNANDQAATVAKILAGRGGAYEAFPWFWSDQYDLKLQTAGLNLGYDEEVLRGDPDSRQFSVGYFREGRILAVDCVNDPQTYVAGRKLITDRVSPDLEKFADPNVPLKELLG